VNVSKSGARQPVSLHSQVLNDSIAPAPAGPSAPVGWPFGSFRVFDVAQRGVSTFDRRRDFRRHLEAAPDDDRQSLAFRNASPVCIEVRWFCRLTHRWKHSECEDDEQAKRAACADVAHIHISLSIPG
jgi:hypothetical protein